MVDDLNWLLLQIFQPYFYYSLVLSLALFIGVHLSVRFTGIKDHRARSYLFAVPLLAPLAVFALYPPQLDIKVMERVPPLLSFPSSPLAFIHQHPGPPAMQSMLSVTGTLCLSGIVIGISLLAVCLVLNRFGTKRGFVPLSEEDYPKALSIVSKRCKRFGIEQPTVGLVEDLRPNAFVGGHGRSTVLLFSLGMLETFDEEELTVAVDHELMHLKNRDTIFRSVVIGLIALSFFNPVAYLSYSAALREREHLADDGSTRSKRSREALKSALKKAAEMTSQVEGMAGVASLRLFGLVPLFPRNMLATHPVEAKRIESISRSDRERHASTRMVCLTLLVVVVLSAVMLTVLVDTRTLLVQDARAAMVLGGNGPQTIDHIMPARSIQMPYGAYQNVTFLPPRPQDRPDLPASQFLNSSVMLVATIAPSN